MIFSLNTLIWLGIVVLFALLEAATVGLVSLWFALGGLAALVTAAITPSVPIQIVVFLAVSFAALVFTRPLVRKARLNRAQPTNADRNIGRKAVVIVPVAPGFPGRVRLDGVDWAACAQEPLPEGTVCTVTQVQGATLTVEAQPAKATVAAAP